MRVPLGSSSKHQAASSRETSSSKLQTRLAQERWSLGFGGWSFSEAWTLELFGRAGFSLGHLDKHLAHSSFIGNLCRQLEAAIGCRVALVGDDIQQAHEQAAHGFDFRRLAQSWIFAPKIVHAQRAADTPTARPELFHDKPLWFRLRADRA